jgi:hypothetical protein
LSPDLRVSSARLSVMLLLSIAPFPSEANSITPVPVEVGDPSADDGHMYSVNPHLKRPFRLA